MLAKKGIRLNGGRSGAMQKNRFQAWVVSLSDIYSLKDDDAKGRLISLGSALTTALYNVFITGVFYTGFLSMYGMSITSVGIISFIPYIGSCFSVFSSVILERIRKRKRILILSKVFFYSLYILATTIMPQFVQDVHSRLIWFAVILFIAHAVYALFSPGFTPWFYFFYPADHERRTRYITLNQIFASVMSSMALILSSIITDALSNTPYYTSVLLGLRYFAFVLVLLDVSMQACAKEYDYPQGPKIRFLQVFTLPFQYRKFLMCLLLMFAWNFIANLNNGLWAYHLLNHMHFSYTLMNAMSMMYTIILIFTSSVWRKILRRYSWIKTFGLAVLIWVPTEVLFFLMTPDRAYMYVPLCLAQNLLSVGLNISYANILYMNLPSENSTAHIAFYSIGCNLFAFLGLMIGTKISSIGGDVPHMLLGMPVYSVQYTTLCRAALMLILGLVLIVRWRSFTPDQDIQEIEALSAAIRHNKRLRRAL